MAQTSKENVRQDVNLTVLPGDGVGPEIMETAVELLEALESVVPYQFHFKQGWIGGRAFDQYGQPLPESTLPLLDSADAVLLGAVGGPKWDHVAAENRPESALLELRRYLKTFANLRPVRVAGPDQNIDMLIVRELTGGIYFGRPRRRTQLKNHQEEAVDTMVYTTEEVERIARMAFRIAERRRGHVVSVDKANVLESSRLWRETVERVASEFSEVKLQHHLVDSFTVSLVNHPESWDVILASNLFGDIISDLAGVFPGSLGLLPSASLGEEKPGLYEPVHGSAPDIAGEGKANPAGMLLSVAMMFRYTLKDETVAGAIENAVDETIDDGICTPDLATGSDRPFVSTREFAQEVQKRVVARLTGAKEISKAAGDMK